LLQQQPHQQQSMFDQKPHILQAQHQQPQQCVLPLNMACFLLAAIHHHPFLFINFINNNKPLQYAIINFPFHPRYDEANQQRKKVVAGKGTVKSDSKITLQLKCEKQLNIETSKTTIQKSPIYQLLKILVIGISWVPSHFLFFF
jgi:hypothetical protein